MREIKFRGKRVDNGEWVYGYYIVTNWAQVYVNSHYVDPATVGQYTGLKDKHWREIYEGDILRYLKVAGHTSTGIVKYITEFARWEYWHTQQNQGFPVLSDCDNMDVIGNIHDNPELHDPQFEGVGESGRINREPPACPVAAKTRGGV